LVCSGTFHRSKAIEIWIERDQINKITIELEKMTEEELLKEGIRKDDIKY
jgi:hypothetical protein